MASESFTWESAHSFIEWAKDFVVDALGGPARFQVIAVMAAVLGLGVVGAGAIIGLIVGGRLSEWLLDRGRIEERVIMPAITLFLSIPLLALGIWTTNLWIGLAAPTAGAGSLATALAPIDAAASISFLPGCGVAPKPGA